MCELVAPCSNVGKQKILLADDNSEIRYLLVLYLEQSGYGTVEAVTGHQAFEHARATGPNLIIMGFHYSLAAFRRQILPNC